MAAHGGSVGCLTGILAHPDQFFSPLRPVLDEFFDRTVVGHYTPGYVDTDMESEKFAHQAARHNLNTIIGVSYGAMMIPFIASKMSPEQRQRTHFILVDPPNGVDTFTQLPNLAAPAFRFMPSNSFDNTFIGRKAMEQMSKGLPKSEYITIPDVETRQKLFGGLIIPVPEGFTVEKLTAEHVDKEYWDAFVMAEAKRNLSGHSFVQWYYQLQWMIEAGRSGQLARKAKAMIGLDVTLVSCIGKGNDVVKQPKSTNWWQKQLDLPDTEVFEVNAVHPGFLQNQPEFAEVFTRIFRGDHATD